MAISRVHGDIVRQQHPPTTLFRFGIVRSKRMVHPGEQMRGDRQDGLRLPALGRLHAHASGRHAASLARDNPGLCELPLPIAHPARVPRTA